MYQRLWQKSNSLLGSRRINQSLGEIHFVYLYPNAWIILGLEGNSQIMVMGHSHRSFTSWINPRYCQVEIEDIRMKGFFMRKSRIYSLLGFYYISFFSLFRSFFLDFHTPAKLKNSTKLKSWTNIFYYTKMSYFV